MYFKKEHKYIAYATRCFKSRPGKYVDVPVSFKVRAKDRMHADKLARGHLKSKYNANWKELSLIKIA